MPCVAHDLLPDHERERVVARVITRIARGPPLGQETVQANKNDGSV